MPLARSADGLLHHRLCGRWTTYFVDLRHAAGAGTPKDTISAPVPVVIWTPSEPGTSAIASYCRSSRWRGASEPRERLTPEE